MGGGVSVPPADGGDVAGAKAMGDTCFRLQDWNKAVYWYSCAVTNVPPGDVDTLSKLLSNRAAAHHEAGSHEKALLDADEVILLAPQWAKGYYRAAKAALALGRAALAARHVEKAMALAPEDTSLPALRTAAMSASSASSSSASARQAARAAGPSWCYSWGNDESSQLGLGAPPSNKSLPTPVAAFAGTHLVAVACGASHTLAVSALGEVFAWGNNEFGQLGIPHLSGCVATPAQVPALVGIRVSALAAGAGHNVALTGDGHAYSWGINRQGQCGLGHTENQAKPALVAALGRPVAAATCGIAHTAFVLDDGSLAMCGSNQFGQLGLGRSFNGGGGGGQRGHTDLAEARVLARTASHAALPKMVPAPVVVLETSGDFRVAHVACGGAHTLLVDTAGRVLSAGSNSCGQLGREVGTGPVGPGSDPLAIVDVLRGRALDHDDDPCFGPVYVPPRAGDDPRPCALVACGEEFSLIVARDHSVFTFGLGIAGQMGDGNLEGYSRPHLVPELEGKKVEDAICSQGQVLAVTAEGTVWTWGTPGDRAHMATLDPSVAILRPETVAAFSRKKKIHTISCGRKHYVLLLAGVYGPLCFVKRGLGAARSRDGVEEIDTLAAQGRDEDTDDDVDMSCTAGDKVWLVVQCVDFHGHVTDSSHGVTFHSSVEHESIDYEFVFRKQCGSGSALNLPLPRLEWDDNMDGTVDGAMRLYVAGQYRVGVTLDQQHIRGSPFTVMVRPGPVHPAQCDVWWSSAFLAPPTAVDGDAKDSAPDNAPSRLHAHVGESVIFSVSLRDKFRNKVSDAAGTAGLGVAVMLDGKEHQWVESTRGVVPCALPSPKEPGEYTFDVSLVGYDGPGSDVITRAVLTLHAARMKPADGGAPEAAAEAPAPAPAAAAAAAAAADAAPAAASDAADISPEDQKLVDAVSRQEMTRKRARDALLRQQAQLARERQAAREKKEAIRRTGGGFVIKYSKDI